MALGGNNKDGGGDDVPVPVVIARGKYASYRDRPASPVFDGRKRTYAHHTLDDVRCKR